MAPLLASVGALFLTLSLKNTGRLTPPDSRHTEPFAVCVRRVRCMCLLQ
jgi:hypothetical protein